VSEIGFSGDALATPPAVSDPTPVVHAALDVGIDLFDAVPYGDGDGEAILARALRGEQRDLVIAARCVSVEHPVWGPDPRAWRPETVRLRMEQALRRLGRDWLDVWLLDNPPEEAVDDEDLWASLELARTQGWIRAVGIVSDAGSTVEVFDPETEAHTTAAPPDIRPVLTGAAPVDAVWVRFGLLAPRLGRFLAGQEAVRDGRVALVAREPLAGVDDHGAADRLVGDFVFPAMDRTRDMAALAGVLSVGSLTAALIDPGTPHAIRELAGASEVPLTPAEQAELEGRWDELEQG
jgi:aryl-alcohol dehydrogenase-like predicted oxidoreductase